MSNNQNNKITTYRWIIGILVGAIVVLLSFLIAKEFNLIEINFIDTLSVATTLCSILLSIFAIYYTFITSRDSKQLSNSMQNTLIDINQKIQSLENNMAQNNKVLNNIAKEKQNIKSSLDSVNKYLEEINNGTTNGATQQSAIKEMNNAKSTLERLLDFLYLIVIFRKKLFQYIQTILR